MRCVCKTAPLRQANCLVWEISEHIWAGRKQRSTWLPIYQLDIKVLCSCRLLVSRDLFILNSHRLKCHHFPLHQRMLCNVSFYVSPCLAKEAVLPSPDPLPPAQTRLPQENSWLAEGGKTTCNVLWQWLLRVFCWRIQQGASPSLSSTRSHMALTSQKCTLGKWGICAFMDTKRPHSIGEKQHCAPSCCLANTQLYAVDSIKKV